MSNNLAVANGLQKAAVVVIGISLLLFPILITTVTTDPFALPKQVLIGTAAAIALILYGVCMVVQRKMFFRVTPFDVAVFVFTLVVLLSSLLAANWYDSLTAFFPLLFAVLLYFSITNLVKDENDIVFVVSSLIIGALLSTLVSVLGFFHVYLLPFAGTHVASFTTFGSLLDQGLYLVIVLPFALYLAMPMFQRKNNTYGSSSNNMLVETRQDATNKNGRATVFTVVTVILLFGFIITLYQLVTTQKPLILPFSVGFQTAFAAISQDTNVLKSFLLGSGFGTYVTDFTRFKPVTFNSNTALWTLTFFRSTSFFLELIATTGFLGTLAFLFLVYRVIKQRTFFLPVVVAFVAAFLLPFSPVIYILFFVVLALFACLIGLQHPRKLPTLEYHFVALNEGLLTGTPETDTRHTNRQASRALPIIVLAIILLLVGTLGYFTEQYLRADLIFEQGLVAASNNDGRNTYSLENTAIGIFPWRDTFYTMFSQTNLALANSLAATQPKNKQPDPTIQNTVLQLIQNSITAGRAAVSISPATAVDWNNLSSIYRSLIGFGQNADNFSILTNQEAIALDPNNPQQYVNLGGIYYQLGQWDNAITQFTTAYQKKTDYANAYYNVGHAYESKGDYNNALQAYEIVQQLVANNPSDKAKLQQDINALQQKIAQQKQTGSSASVPTPSVTGTPEAQQSLNVNSPEAQLPQRNPKATIPGPSISPIPTTEKTTPSPTSGATTTATP